MCVSAYVLVLLSTRECVEASMRPCVCASVCACFYCAPEDVFQSLFKTVYGCFCLPGLNTVSDVVLWLFVCVQVSAFVRACVRASVRECVVFLVCY